MVCCSHITPTSISTVTCPSFSVSVSYPLLMRAREFGFRLHPSPLWSHFNQLHLGQPYFQIRPHSEFPKGREFWNDTTQPTAPGIMKTPGKTVQASNPQGAELQYFRIPENLPEKREPVSESKKTVPGISKRTWFSKNKKLHSDFKHLKTRSTYPLRLQSYDLIYETVAPQSPNCEELKELLPQNQHTIVHTTFLYTHKVFMPLRKKQSNSWSISQTFWTEQKWRPQNETLKSLCQKTGLTTSEWCAILQIQQKLFMRKVICTIPVQTLKMKTTGKKNIVRKGGKSRVSFPTEHICTISLYSRLTTYSIHYHTAGAQNNLFSVNQEV